jgi:opacity protein-like surface antigen
MNRYAKRTALAAACAVTVCGLAMPAHAANWVMLQGTEPANAAGTATLWGFVQAEYQKDYSDPNTVNPNVQGQYIPPKMLGPDLNNQEGFNISRARLGVRGQNFPLDAKVNYFLLAEFGNNGITHTVDGTTTNATTTPSGVSSKLARLTDASITLNHIPGGRVRVGLFKTPGFEEGLQAIQVLNYVNFTEVGNQLMLERLPNHYFTNNPAATNPLQPDTLNGFNQPVAAFRDTGIQLFDAFTTGNWEHSYALMLGNGSGLSFSDTDSSMDRYYYLSTERIFGGEGPMREGIKLFGWAQHGRRLLDQTNDNTYNPVEHDRKRTGVGVTWLLKPLRVTAEYIKGEGMIFVGPDKPTFDQNGITAAFGDGADGKASGWYVETGWRIPQTRFELDLRYDLFNRLEDDVFESRWEAWTVGLQYHLNPKSRITLNYAVRDVTSVNFSAAGLPTGPGTGIYAAGANPNNAMETIGDRLALQFTAIF